MTEEERNRLELALRVMARIDKVSELNEAEFRLLGYNDEYEDHHGKMVFRKPVPAFCSKMSVRERCVDIVLNHITKENPSA